MPAFSLHGRSLYALIAAALAIAIIILVVWKRDALLSGLRQSAEYARLLMSRPLRTLSALLSSMGLTSLHSLGLYCVLLSLNIHANWPLALLAVSAGSLGSGLAPTPGGLGGAEAGIAAVLVGFSVPPSDAAAAALIYRGITYWLPLLPGYIALRVVEKRYL
jgi:undecaprenyl-diphosphatase